MTIRQHEDKAPSLNGIPMGKGGPRDKDQPSDVPRVEPERYAAAEMQNYSSPAHRISGYTQPGFYRTTFRRYWAVVLAGLISGLLLGWTATATMTPQYRSTSQVFISFQSSDVSPESTLQALSFTQQQVVSYADIVASPLVLQPVIDDLGLDENAASLAERVDANTRTDTVLIDISVTDGSPAMAQRIADEISLTLGDVIADLERADGDTRLPVQVTTVQPGKLPEDPSSPNSLFIVAVGGAVGASMGLGLSLLLQSRRRDDVTGSGPSIA